MSQTDLRLASPTLFNNILSVGKLRFSPSPPPPHARTGLHVAPTLALTSCAMSFHKLNTALGKQRAGREEEYVLQTSVQLSVFQAGPSTACALRG